MPELPRFTPDELHLLADRRFFPAKARIMAKVKDTLDAVHVGLKAELAGAALVAPPTFDPAKFQFVKGEQLETFPYQYLDFPKHFAGEEKLTFRSLFWWGHAFVFALILEGPHLVQCKKNLINRYHEVAGKEVQLSLAPTPWEWKSGEGYTLPLTHDRKSEVAAVLSGRRFFKLGRYVPLDDPAVREGLVPALARETWRTLLPVLTP